MFDWLKDSWQFMLQHWLSMLIIIIPLTLIQNYLLSSIPLEALYTSDGSQNDAASLGSLLFEYWPTFALLSLFGLLQSALLILTMTQLLGGEKFNLSKVLSRALVVFIPFFFLTVVTVLYVSLGLLLLIVPGIYIMFKLILAPYCMLVDGARLFASISQSWRLTKGYVGELFGGLIIISILSTVPTWFYNAEGSDFFLIDNIIQLMSACISASWVIYAYRLFDYAKANPRN